MELLGHDNPYSEKSCSELGEEQKTCGAVLDAPCTCRKGQAYNKSIWQWSGTKICSSRGLAGTLLMQVAVIENKQVLSACGLYQLIGCNVASLLAL